MSFFSLVRMYLCYYVTYQALRRQHGGSCLNMVPLYLWEGPWNGASTNMWPPHLFLLQPYAAASLSSPKHVILEIYDCMSCCFGFCFA